MIELVRDLRVINVLTKFENDPWKIMDVRVLTVIFHVRSWKMRKKIAKIFFCRLWKNPELILITMLSPTFVPNLVTLAWTRRSENDDTPQPLDQWTNSPFMGRQVGNWSICHALWPKRKPIVHPTFYPTHISFIPSQTTFPFLKYGYQKFDLENTRSRSWVRSKF